MCPLKRRIVMFYAWSQCLVEMLFCVFETRPLCRFLQEVRLRRSNYLVHIRAVVMRSYTLQRPGCRGPLLRLHRHIHS